MIPHILSTAPWPPEHEPFEHEPFEPGMRVFGLWLTIVSGVAFWTAVGWLVWRALS